MQLYEIPYSDLLLLSSSSASCSHYQERMIMENLGPTGPGLFAITNVPDASLLRRKLLPLARKLALLSPDDRKRILRVISTKSLFAVLYIAIISFNFTLYVLMFDRVLDVRLLSFKFSPYSTSPSFKKGKKIILLILLIRTFVES